MKNNLGLSKLIEQYKDKNLLNDLESGLRKEHSENISMNLLEMNPLCSKYFLKKEQYNYIENTINEGLVEPILVRKRNGKYQVLTGFKRYFLAKKNKVDSLPAIVEEISDDLMLLIVIERLRTFKDENILNKANIYDQILKLYKITRKELAALLGVSISQITNTLRILKLNENIKKALKEEKLSYGHARMLVCLSEDEQLRFMDKIMNERLSVREIERVVYKFNNDNENDNLSYILEEKELEINIKFKTKKDKDDFLKKLK